MATDYVATVNAPEAATVEVVVREQMDASVTESLAPLIPELVAKLNCQNIATQGYGRGGDIKIFAQYRDILTQDEERVEIACFRLQTMPGCSAIMVSSHERVSIPQRGKGIGRMLQKLRCDIAKRQGCQLIQCTTIEANIRQNKLLLQMGWHTVQSFDNPATGNKVVVWLKTL